MAAFLLIEQGPRSGTREALETSLVVAGRDAECTLHLPGTFISRRQFQIEAKGGELILENLAALHVTLLNGQEEPGPVPLEHDDLIDAGATRLRFCIDRPAAAYASAEILGASWQTERLREQITQVAPTSTPVLIRGDRGVGKSLVARAIHVASERTSFVTFNAAYAFDQTEGTLFLEEVGDLSAEDQAKLLALSTRVRIVASASREFPATYDHELTQRLSAVRIELTPLCTRKDDIAALASSLVARHEAALTPAALDVLRAHPWPGNVSELKAVIERAVIFHPASVLDADAIDLEPTIADGLLSRERLERALSVTKTRRRAAAVLGISRSTLQKHLERLAIP